jgi:nitrogen PTS system EIIA component
MAYTDLLTADGIVMLVEPGTRDTVLDAAARLLSGGDVLSTQAIGAGLRERERIASTAVGRGVALPHCRSNAFSTARAAFLRLGVGVDFGSGDGEPVDLVFAMCVPEDLAREHLRTMAELAERFSDPGFRASLRDAGDISALRAALARPAEPTTRVAPAA